MLSVKIYGFGSAFGDMDAAHDIDLLILHPNTELVSCRLAIQCKKRLVACVARAHITMLSEAEERHFQFIKAAHAIFLGNIRGYHVDDDVAALCCESIVAATSFAKGLPRACAQ